MYKRKRRRRNTIGQRPHRHVPPGSEPGLLSANPAWAKPVIRVLSYDAERVVDRQFDSLDGLDVEVARWPVTWIHIAGLGDMDLLAQLGDMFGLHELALEDVIAFPKRAKVEDYGRQVFLILHTVRLTERMETQQLNMFLGPNYLITLEERPSACLNPVFERVIRGGGEIRTSKADYLAYAIVDAVVDYYFPVLDRYSERLELLDAEVGGSDLSEDLSRIRELRNDLLQLRRVLWPHREVIAGLLRDPTSLVTANTRTYLRDCLDHVIELVDLLDIDREMCSDMREYGLALLSNRMTDIMKVLTIIATLFMPLSFIAGVYGMNFNTENSPWNMPELDWYLGYPFALALMAMVAGGMLFFFHRRGWLRPAELIEEQGK